MSHNVAVVSMEQVTTELGATAFQLSEVIGGKLITGSLLWVSVSSALSQLRTLALSQLRNPSPAPSDHLLPLSVPE